MMSPYPELRGSFASGLRVRAKATRENAKSNHRSCSACMYLHLVFFADIISVFSDRGVKFDRVFDTTGLRLVAA